MSACVDLRGAVLHGIFCRSLVIFMTLALLLGAISGQTRATLAAAIPPSNPSSASLAKRGRRSRQPAPAEVSASYSRYSSEMQDETSIDQQRQACRDFSAKER